MLVKKWNGKAKLREVFNMSLKEIRLKNANGKSLLMYQNTNVNYSDDLIKQCKNEFETFVKPIRNRVLKRNEGIIK